MFNIQYSDMYEAYLDCKKHKSNKYGAKKFELNALYNIIQLTDEINKKEYTLSPSQCFIIKYPAIREIFCANFRDRVVQHYVYLRLNPIIDKMLIYDAANCRKTKGTDFAIKRVSLFARKASQNQNNNYYLKMDLSGFFMRIDRQYLLSMLLQIIDNYYNNNDKEALIYLIKIIILSDVTKNATRLSSYKEWSNLPQRKTLFNNPNGLPIGNICSQLCANLYLNNLDHMLKHRHKYVSRYVDDIIVIDNKDKLIETLSLVQKYLPMINMKLSLNKTKILPLKYGIPYLGVKIFPLYTIVGKTRINRLFYSSQLFKNATDAYKRSVARLGMFQHYHGYNIIKRWYTTLPNYIKQNMKFNNGKL